MNIYVKVTVLSMPDDEGWQVAVEYTPGLPDRFVAALLRSSADSLDGSYVGDEAHSEFELYDDEADTAFNRGDASGGYPYDVLNENDPGLD